MEKTEEWVLILQKSNYHAKGLAVVKKITTMFSGQPYIRYKYGDFPISEEHILKVWPLDTINLEWIDLNQEYIPTFIEKLKYKLFSKGYPKTIKVRPIDNTLIVMQYSGCDHMEVAEYYNKNWVTDLYFPAECSKWAYIPKEFIIEANNKSL